MTVIALDMGGTLIKAGIVTNGAVVAQDVIEAQSGEGLAARLPAIEACVRPLTDSAGSGSPCGIGVSVPGIVDVASARITSINEKYADAPTLDLRAWARERFGLPLFMENDARMALLGEQRYGAARGVDDVVMMTLGTGIGVAAMIDGRLVRGRHGQAAILGGHLTIRLDGHRCTCGNVGCAESEASVSALPQLAQRFNLSAETSSTYRALFAAAARGEAAAVEARQHSLRVWSAQVVSLIHAFDPSLVVLGGGIMGSAEQILPYVRDYVAEHAWTPWGTVEIVPGLLGDRAALLACAALVEEQLSLNQP